MANGCRLIDANALTEHIKDLPTWYDDGGLSWACIEGYPKGNFDPQDIISSIENAPPWMPWKWCGVRSASTMCQRESTRGMKKLGMILPK